MCKKTVVVYFRTTPRMPARPEEHHCDPETDLSKSRPRFERNSPEYNLEALLHKLYKPPCSATKSHQFLLARPWLMFKRCASYPFQNLCTCSSFSCRDAISSSCTQMYPPPSPSAQAFKLELNNVLYLFFYSFLLSFIAPPSITFFFSPSFFFY
jgi:hypothetical protein